MNAPAAILALAVAAAAGWAIHGLDDAAQPLAAAGRLSVQPGASPAQLAALYSEALRGDVANPYRWADLGDALVLDNRPSQAGYCFERALALNRRLPQIWLRDANFHFETGTPAAALQSAVRVLLTVPDYDGVLFGYFDRMVGDPAVILAALGGDPRASISYARHLVAAGQVAAARTAWNQLRGRGLSDPSLTSDYLRLLLRNRLYAEARQDWMQAAPGPVDPSNLLYNGSFETDPTGSPFDWRIEPSGQFRTTVDDKIAHDGRRSLHIRFLGNANVAYANLTQLAVVSAGTYELQAWVRTQSITTNECPRIEVVDTESPSHFEIRTAPICGSRDWSLVTQRITVSAPAPLLAVRVLRAPSDKFDNKIAGDFWLDSVRLYRVP